MYTNLNNPANYQLQDFGQFGFRVLDSSSMVVDGETYRTLYVLDDAVVSATSAKADDLVSKALLAGTLLHGLFSAPSVTSGKVLAYMAGRLTAQEILDLYKAYVIANGGTLELESETLSKLQALGTDDYADASLVLMPSGYKTSVLFSERPMDTDGQIDFTRASNATRVDANGLVEKVRTNLILQSNQFDTTWAIGLNTTLTDGYSDPSGGNNAWRLTMTSGGGTFLTQNFVFADAPYTLSLWAKANGNTNLSLQIASSLEEVFVLTNEWQRISFTYTSLSGSSTISIGNGISDVDALIYGAQLEQGDIATDYIPTTTSARSTFAGITVDGTSVPNVPRLDYSGGATCPSLLLEPQRTNVLTFSEQFDNAAWTKFGGVVLANTETSPDGAINSDTLQGNGSTVQIIISQGQTLSAGQFTSSIFAKADTANFLELTFDNFAGASNISGIFDLSNGTTSSVGANIQSFNNGWYKCSLTSTIVLGDVIGSLGFRIRPNASNIFYPNAAATIGQNIYLWGAQVEAGSYATSYIPTLATSVTRVADAASKTGISNLIGQTEGTLFAEFNGYENTGDEGNRIIAVGDGTSSTRILIFDSNTNIRFFMASGGTQVDYTSSVIAEGNHKVAIGYANNDVAMYIDGVQVSTDTNATIPACPNLYVGTREDGSVSTGVLAGSINQALLFKTRLSNDKLAALTTL